MIWRFGEFEVDVPLFQLRHEGEAVKLERLVFDLLLYLIEQRRRVVLRHELFAQLWPHETVVSTALPRVVSTLRSALGDDAQKPRYIETIRGRGYRFVHPVHAANSNSATQFGASRDAFEPVAGSHSGADPGDRWPSNGP